MNIIIALLLLSANDMTSPRYSAKKVFKKDLKSIAVSVEIVPARGWKWNKNYPSKFFVNLPPNTRVVEKNVTYIDERPNFKFNIQGQVKLIKEITVDGSFSLCTKTTCRSWRHVKFWIGEKNETKSL